MSAFSGIADLEMVLAARKRLVGTLDWKSQHPGRQHPQRSDRVQISAAVEVDGVTLEAVTVLIAASTYEPDRMVAAQIMVLHHGKPHPVTRIDWRDKVHTNTRNPASRLHMATVADTHIHRLGDNAFLGWPGILSPQLNLPEADATPPIDDFATLMSYVSREFAIVNATEIREPPWQPWLI